MFATRCFFFEILNECFFERYFRAYRLLIHIESVVIICGSKRKSRYKLMYKIHIIKKETDFYIHRAALICYIVYIVSSRILSKECNYILI